MRSGEYNVSAPYSDVSRVANIEINDMKINILSLVVMLGTIISASSATNATNIHGAGASSVAPLLYELSGLCKDEMSLGLSFHSIGSGDGVKRVLDNKENFAVTDIPFSNAELDKYGLTQFPIILGGVVLAVNLDGVLGGQLTLDDAAVARIFLGEIKKWDDPAIAKLNPSVKLPPADIVVVHRSDGSGMSFVFTEYLSKVSADWRLEVGFGKTVKWPTGIGARGNEGVVNSILQTKGAIGYVGYAHVGSNRLAYTKLVNRDGVAVEPTPDSFKAAADKAGWSGGAPFEKSLTDQPGSASWPITNATFALLRDKVGDAEGYGSILSFFDWVYSRGDATAAGLGYVPLPDDVKKRVRESWNRGSAWKFDSSRMFDILGFCSAMLAAWSKIYRTRK